MNIMSFEDNRAKFNNIVEAPDHRLTSALKNIEGLGPVRLEALQEAAMANSGNTEVDTINMISFLYPFLTKIKGLAALEYSIYNQGKQSSRAVHILKGTSNVQPEAYNNLDKVIDLLIEEYIPLEP